MKIQSSNIYLYSTSLLESGQKSNLGYDILSQNEVSHYASGDDKHTLQQLKSIAKSNLSQNAENTDEILASVLSKSLKATINEIKNLNQTQTQDFNFNKIQSYKYEETSINIAAKIKTNDSQIDINIKYNLKNSFMTQNQIISGKTIVSDPLIISLDDKFPTLSSNKFEFDMDSDGSAWQISKLKEGSGFLALDKNSDGKINNANELFGTKSGNGFTDLAEFDDDKNGWIDENDKIFHKLRIWLKTDKDDRLIGLGEVGVGAIFLGSVRSQMDLKDGSYQTANAELKSTGFFLRENGSAGVIAQVDLVKSKDKNFNLLEQKNLNMEILNTQKGFISTSKKSTKNGEISNFIKENFSQTGIKTDENGIKIKTHQESDFEFIQLKNFDTDKRLVLTNTKRAKITTIPIKTHSSLVKDEFKKINTEQRQILQNKITVLQNILAKTSIESQKRSINQQILTLQTQLLSLEYI